MIHIHRWQTSHEYNFDAKAKNKIILIQVCSKCRKVKDN